MNCKHIPKTIEWKLINGNYSPVRWDCTKCDLVSEIYSDFDWEEEPSGHANHTEYTDGCFACKLGTLQLNTGDAGRADSMSKKKWDKELNAYAEARSQGIQPAGTTMKAINEAKAASDKLGKAYNAETMPAASKITKQVASVGKETGTI